MKYQKVNVQALAVPPDISVHNQAYYKLYIMAEIDNR